MSVQGETREKTRVNIREPKQYQVIMHNDDFTSMDFVVDILMCIFHKEEAEANGNKGSGSNSKGTGRGVSVPDDSGGEQCIYPLKWQKSSMQ